MGHPKRISAGNQQGEANTGGIDESIHDLWGRSQPGWELSDEISEEQCKTQLGHVGTLRTSQICKIPGLVNIQKAIGHGHLYWIVPINSMVIYPFKLPEAKFSEFSSCFHVHWKFCQGTDTADTWAAAPAWTNGQVVIHPNCLVVVRCFSPALWNKMKVKWVDEDLPTEWENGKITCMFQTINQPII